jgi:hypothetical protein
MTPPLSPPPGGVPPAAKKNNVLLWVVVGVGGFVALIVILVVAGGLFLVHKVKQAGVDPELFQRNPALAATKIMTAMNPDVEIVSVDEGRQEIVLREKRTGNTYTISYDDARKGRFKMKENGKDTVTIGGDARVPTWVPDYPGSNPQAAFAAQGKDGQSGTFTFKTKDSAEKVTKYYQDEFQTTGLKIVNRSTKLNGGFENHMLMAQDEANKHTVMVMTGAEGDGTTVSVTYSTNK